MAMTMTAMSTMMTSTATALATIGVGLKYGGYVVGCQVVVYQLLCAKGSLLGTCTCQDLFFVLEGGSHHGQVAPNLICGIVWVCPYIVW